MANFKSELKALQTWAKAVAGLNSYRLKEGMPALARPVIVWETPSRGRDRYLSRYTYVVKVIQFGRLYVKSIDQAADLQELLLADLEEKFNMIPIIDGQGKEIAKLKQVKIEFDHEAAGTSSLGISFKVTYEATYARTKPVPAPAATYVGNKITT